MLARISTFQAEPGRIEDGIPTINEKIIPTLKGIDGFRAVNFLADRTSGKLVAIAFWDNSEALEASVEAVNPIRTTLAEAIEGKVTSVESFEVVAQSW
jgi:hypothetical protein